MSEEICTCGHALAMHQPYGVHQPSDRCLVFVCSCKGYTERPLPPTAEQTSIARFNALADEMRELHTTLNCIIGALGRIEHYVEQSSLKRAVDSGCICLGNWRKIVSQTEPLMGRNYLSATGAEFVLEGLVHTEEDYYYGMRDMKTGKWALLSCVVSIEGHGFSAVAKKKAAPLVGKKGTGRKG